MRSKLKTKYTTITFNEEFLDEGTCFWVAVQMAWKETDEPKALAFSNLMDERLRDRVREVLPDAVSDPSKDIELQDADLLVNFVPGKKHLGAKLIGVVHSVEAEFDNAIEDGQNVIA